MKYRPGLISHQTVNLKNSYQDFFGNTLESDDNRVLSSRIFDWKHLKLITTILNSHV